MEETEKVLKEKHFYPCQLFAEELRANKWTKIRNRVILRQQYSREFDAVWEELLQDSRFVQEMRVSTLDQDFNLNLLFNVFGLMRPQYCNTKCRGALSIARLVGYNADLKNQYHCYSKDYFNENEIEKLRFGFKTDELLDHVRSIIQKHCKHEV
jgi:hypothetical protein